MIQHMNKDDARVTGRLLHEVGDNSKDQIDLLPILWMCTEKL